MRNRVGRCVEEMDDNDGGFNEGESGVIMRYDLGTRRRIGGTVYGNL